MKTTARRLLLILPSSGLSNQELIGMMPPLLSIFEKGLPSRITDQLALTGQRLKTLQQFDPGGRSTQLHQPQRMKILQDTSPQRGFLQNLQPLLPRPWHPDQRYPPKLPRSSIKKASSMGMNVQEGKRRDFDRTRSCQIGKKKGTCEITNNVPSSRFILFDSLNQPYRVLLDSGANVSFISLEFAKRQSLPLTDINSFPVYLVNSSKEPSFWVSKKAKWTFHFSNFPSFEWDLTVLDAPGMDYTILGHDFLVYWNPD
ncbi:aspartyl protease family protein, partial [Puccinia sorghi]